MNKIINRKYFIVLILFITCLSVLSNSLTAQTVVDTIGLGGPPSGNGLFPRAVCVNSTTNMIYVANGITNNLSVIDGANNEIIETISVGDSPVEVSVNSTTNMIYVAASLSGDVTVITDNPVATELTVIPPISSKSIRRQNAVVTVLDKNGKPMKYVKVTAGSTGNGGILVTQ